MFQIILKFKRGKYLIWAPAKLSLTKVLAQERKTLKMGKKQQQLQPYPMDRQNYCCQEQGCRTSGGNPTGGVEKVKRRRVSKAKRSLEPGMEQLLFTSTFSPRANRS